MIKCMRRQASDPQKLKKLSTIVLSFLLVEAKAEAVDEITASTFLVKTLNNKNAEKNKFAIGCKKKMQYKTI